jgi:quercetin dioxygenase-like cupin family protein
MQAQPILFDQIEWQSPQPGARYKVFRGGTQQVRLLEFTQEFVESQWCEKGHAGFVMSGELEIDFSGRVVRFPQGAAVLIPAGPAHAHKARAVTPVVRLFVVEEVSASMHAGQDEAIAGACKKRAATLESSYDKSKAW